VSGQKQILTIAGRWKQHVQASGIDRTLPRREQALAMLMFYAGFAASLEAGLELAELPEEEAAQLLQLLHTEVKQVEAMASHLVSGRPAS
jgi:hypothetical protein